jgi:hypothetical protein
MQTQNIRTEVMGIPLVRLMHEVWLHSSLNCVYKELEKEDIHSDSLENPKQFS